MTRKHLIETGLFVLVAVVLLGAGINIFFTKPSSQTNSDSSLTIVLDSTEVSPEENTQDPNIPSNQNWAKTFEEIDYSKQTSASVVTGGEAFPGWKTYRNDWFGFELQHPNDWVVKQNGATYFYVIPKVPFDIVTDSKRYQELRDYNHIRILPVGTETHGLPGGFRDEAPTAIKGLYQTLTGFDRSLSTGEKYFSRLNFNQAPPSWREHGFVDSTAVIEPTGGCVEESTEPMEIGDGCLLRITHGTPNIAARAIQEKILSTFRFVDAIDTTNWKTFALSKKFRSVSFKYPPQFVVDETQTDENIGKVVFKDESSPEKPVIIFQMNEHNIDPVYNIKYLIAKIDSGHLLLSREENLPPKNGEKVIINALSIDHKWTFTYTNMSGKNLEPLFQTILQVFRDGSVG